jgi:ribosomal protein S27AE
MTIWNRTKPGRYERQPRNVIPYRLTRERLCPTCGGMVIGIDTGYKSRCPKCGPVVCVSMLATDAPLFKAFFIQQV